MIGDDDFFMQNADYHYGASDVEKMYGRNYSDSSSYGRYNSDSFGRYNSGSSGGYNSGSYGGYNSGSYEGHKSGSYGGTSSNSQNTSSGNDSSGKYCLVGVLIVLAIIIMATVGIPAITNSMASSVSVDDLKITRYAHSIQYESKVSTEKGYEITYNETSYGQHAINVIFYSKNEEILYNDSMYVGTAYLGEVPYLVHLDEKADYAVFEVYRNHLDYGECIYRERVDVDNKNVKKEFTNYDTFYN